MAAGATQLAFLIMQFVAAAGAPSPVFALGAVRIAFGANPWFQLTVKMFVVIFHQKMLITPPA